MALSDIPSQAECDEHASELSGLRATAACLTACAVGLDQPELVAAMLRRLESHHQPSGGLPRGELDAARLLARTQEGWNTARAYMVMMADIIVVAHSFEICRVFCCRGRRRHPFFLRMKAQDWYAFARIIRNCLSHAYILKDLPGRPISWGGLTFTRAMEGELLQRDGFFTHAHAMDLVDTMIQTARAGYPLRALPMSAPAG